MSASHSKWPFYAKTATVTALATLAIVTFVWIINSPTGDVTEKGEDTLKKTEEKREPPKRLLIIYATQSGTAEDMANELNKKVSTKEYRPYVIPSILDVEDIDPSSLLEYDILCFIVSTYGIGEPPMSAEDFWRDLKMEKPDLTGKRIMLFGLGDRSYGDMFNRFSQNLFKKLTSFGAEPLGLYSRGDDGGDIWSDWNKWLQKNLKALKGEENDNMEDESEHKMKQITPSVSCITLSRPGTMLPIRDVTLKGTQAKDVHAHEQWTVINTNILTGSRSEKENRRLAHLHISPSNVSPESDPWGRFDEAFRAGTQRYVMSIIPTPKEPSLQALIDLDILYNPIPEMSLLDLIVCTTDALNVRWPSGLSLRCILTDYLDILGSTILSKGSPNDQLTELLSYPATGSPMSMHSIPWEKIRRAKWNAWQFLVYLKSIAPDEAFRLDPSRWLLTLELSRPRLYSIANADETNQIELLASETPTITSDGPVILEKNREELIQVIHDPNFRKILLDPIVGCLTSRHLLNIRGAEYLRARLSLESQTPPIEATSPVLLVGTGSGLAPLRRCYQSLMKDPMPIQNPKTLIFGNRYLDDDLPFFHDEILNLAVSGWQIILCESRSPNSEGQNEVERIRQSKSFRFKRISPSRLILDSNALDQSKGSITLVENAYVQTEVTEVLSERSMMKGLIRSHFEEDKCKAARIEICGSGRMITSVLEVIKGVLESIPDGPTTESMMKKGHLSFEKFS